MRKKSKAITMTVVIAILLVSFFMAYSLWTHRNAPFTELTNLGVTLSSWAISVGALVVALVTYFSIDSVNTLTSMDGNVLENERYTIAYRELVQQYRSCRSRAELETAVFDHVITMLKTKSNTCMEFTDCVQRVIDNILWFAYLDQSTEDFQAKRAVLIGLLEGKMQRYSSLSNGNLYLLSENIKLIKNVLGYQDKRQGVADGKQTEMDLLDIRARTIANPVTQTVYYDYLGLEYRSRAARLVRQACSMQGDEYLPGNLRILQNWAFREERREIILLLEQSRQAFARAGALSGEDLLWEGYIRFNMARTELLYALVSGKPLDGAMEMLGRAIDARYAVSYLFGEDKAAYLTMQFEKEAVYAAALRLCCRSAFYGCTEEERGEAERLLNICKASREPKIYERIRGYLEEILSGAA